MNNLPVVRSPLADCDFAAGLHLSLRANADAGYLFIQQLETGDGVGRLVNALVWRIIAR